MFIRGTPQCRRAADWSISACAPTISKPTSRRSGAPERLDVGFEIVGAHAEIDQSAALLHCGVPRMNIDRLEERDQLDIRPVGESDERVVRAYVVPAAGHDSEAEFGEA